MAEKTNEQLLEMLKRPGDWPPKAFDAARAELQRRGVDANTINRDVRPKLKARTLPPGVLWVLVGFAGLLALYGFCWLADLAGEGGQLHEAMGYQYDPEAPQSGPLGCMLFFTCIFVLFGIYVKFFRKRD